MSFSSLAQRIEDRIEGYEDLGLSVFLGVLCFLSFVLFPHVDVTGVSGRLVTVAYTLLFIAGSFIGGLRGGWRRFAITLAVAGVVSSWVAGDFRVGLWLTINLVTSILFMLLLCAALTRQVFRPGEINGHRIRGAVSVYLLVGFVFALGFVLLEQFDPGSFHGLLADPAGGHMRGAVYFSFVTLTTLGFGDITPASEFARTFVILEAVIGQLFLVVLIGRLVSLDVARGVSRKS